MRRGGDGLFGGGEGWGEEVILMGLGWDMLVVMALRSGLGVFPAVNCGLKKTRTQVVDSFYMRVSGVVGCIYMRSLHRKVATLKGNFYLFRSVLWV